MSPFSVRCLSLTLPPQPSEMKQTVPCGVIPIKYFAVLWCLYAEYVSALASKLDGCFKNISKQSIMTAQEGQYLRNSTDIVLRRISQSDHKIWGFNITYSTSITCEKIREMVLLCTPKRYARSCPDKFILRHISVMRSCWN